MWILTHELADVIGEGKEGLLGMNTFYLFKLDGKEEGVQSHLHLSDEVIEQYLGLTGQKGHYNEFLLVSKREGGSEAVILKLMTSPQDYWYLTNDADDLAAIERLSITEGSDTLAIQKLALEGVP